jgi:hypothetical protein
MNATDAEIQERVDRLFDRFERMSDAEFMVMRSAWDAGDADVRQDAWKLVKVALKATQRDALLEDARNRIASWVNNYPAQMAVGDVPAVIMGSGMDPGTVRRQAIPPMLDAIAATICADGLDQDERHALLKPYQAIAP